jgi:hypothetical protein
VHTYFQRRVLRHQDFFFPAPPTPAAWERYCTWWEPLWRTTSLRPWQEGVYIVQFLAAPTILKIGASIELYNRVSSLRHQFGPVRSLMVIPAGKGPGENTLHRMFAPYRVAPNREAFDFATDPARAPLEALYRAYPAYVVQHPRYDEGKTESRHRLTQRLYGGLDVRG